MYIFGLEYPAQSIQHNIMHYIVFRFNFRYSRTGVVLDPGRQSNRILPASVLDMGYIHGYETMSTATGWFFPVQDPTELLYWAFIRGKEWIRFQQVN